MGLLTPGSINDNGWNAIAYEGLLRIRKELGAEISHQETKAAAEFEEGFRSYGAKGFDLAFGHGFEFQDSALKAGAQYPGTVFITPSGSSVAKNVSPMVFQLEQATYLLGIIVARQSKTGRAGVVGGIKLPSIESTFIAFRTGAQSVNPKFEVKEIYTGNFDDLGRPRHALGVCLHGQDGSRSPLSAACLLAGHERRNCVSRLERSPEIDCVAGDGRRGRSRPEAASKWRPAGSPASSDMAGGLLRVAGGPTRYPPPATR